LLLKGDEAKKVEAIRLFNIDKDIEVTAGLCVAASPASKYPEGSYSMGTGKFLPSGTKVSNWVPIFTDRNGNLRSTYSYRRSLHLQSS